MIDLCLCGRRIIVSPPHGGAARTYYDGFLKSDRDFMIVIHSNFLSAMHIFRVNEVLLQAGYDVIVIFPPGAFQTAHVAGF